MQPATSEPGASTRDRLLTAATRAFAENGVERASLLEISRRAGQRNRGAVHYHFGSRHGLVVAVLEQYVDALALRYAQLIEVAAGHDDHHDLRPLVEAAVLPMVELAATGWRGRCYLGIVVQVLNGEPDEMHPDLVDVLNRTGAWQIFDLLAERIRQGRLRLPNEVVAERLVLMAGFVVGSVTIHASSAERRGAWTPGDRQGFARNIVAMATGMLIAELA